MKRVIFILFILLFSCNQQKPIVDYNRDYSEFQNYSNIRKRNNNIKLLVNNQLKNINKLHKYTEDTSKIKSIIVKKDTLYINGKIQVINIVDIKLK